MGERINLSEELNKNTFLGSLIISMVTETSGDNAIQEFKLADGKGFVDLDFRINDKPISVAVFEKLWARNRGIFIYRGVRELMKRRVSRLSNKLFRVETVINRAVDDLMRAEFPEEYRDRYED